MTIDLASLAALGRLTENEKACLRRRLLHQTAKEMAIDLGVSPHAVEKRLKMARTKLGLSSSLDAARLLAGYERVVPKAPDLAAPPEPGDIPAHRQASPLRRIGWISGAVIMSLIIATALFLGLPHARQDTRSYAPGMREASLDEVTAFLVEGFGFHDIDHSGFLETEEVSRLEPRDLNRDRTLPPAPPAGSPDPAAVAKWLPKLDTDRDGRVSRYEYIVYMSPWIMLSGVPVDWRAPGQRG